MPRKLTLNEFITKANEIHNHEYNYEKFIYGGAHTKGIIIHKLCGREFQMQACNHTNQGQGCPHCFGTPKSSLEEFSSKSNKIHNNEYDCSMAIYISNGTPIKLKHKICGYEFYTVPYNHLHGVGCPKCTCKKQHEAQKMTLNNFINKAIARF